MSRFRNLDAEVARLGIGNQELSEAIGRSTESVDKKRARKIDWKLNEMLAIRNTYFPGFTLDYLFGEVRNDA